MPTVASPSKTDQKPDTAHLVMTNQPAGGQKAATKLITDDKVDILVGGYSSAVTSAYEQTVAEYSVPFVVTGASSPIITHRTDINTSYVFHHCRRLTHTGSIPPGLSTR